MALWNELKRRHVFRVAAAYAVVAWLLAQIASVVFDTFEAPAIVGQLFLVFLALGFPIALLLAWAYELTPAGIRPSSEVEATQSTSRQAARRFNLAIIALLGVAVVFLAARNFLPETTTQTSIAVLPFKNLTGDPAQDPFADGFVTELHNSLAQIDDLRVSALTSSMSFRETDANARAIAAELGVDYLLEGSVNRVGDAGRIVASLIRGEDGTSVWSSPYDRELDDPHSVQVELAEAVAGRLSVTFGIGDFDRLSGGTENVEAYDHYLLGLGYSRSGIDARAAGEFQRALELDPEFGLAQVHLAQWSFDAMQTIGLTLTGPAPAGFEVALDEVRETIARARELVPNHPTLQLIDARIYRDERRWSDAEAMLVARLAGAGSSDYLGNLTLGALLADTGRAREALPLLEYAHELDPLAAEPLSRLALVYDTLGDSARAFEMNARAERLDTYDIVSIIPHFWRVLATNGEEAARRFQGAHGLDQFLDGYVANYEQFEAGGQSNAPAGIVGNIAYMAAWRGDVDSAIELLRAAVLEAPLFLYNVWSPLMQDVRRHPDFELLMSEMGLPAYWRASSWPEYCRPVEPEGFECD